MHKTACQIYVPYVQILLQFQVSLKPIISTKRSAPTKAPAVGAKRQRKMLTIAEKVELLDMLKEGKSYAATGRHYGINESSVRSIKKEENNIRTTAAIIFNVTATAYHYVLLSKKHTCTMGFRTRKRCRAQSGCSGSVRKAVKYM